MINTSPILSICIPTYNRANNLRDTLESIVSQKRFLETSDVEIVISDNCSDDQTCDVANSYLEAHGHKIKYYRNEENVKDLNFELALSRGEGSFLKLNNDTLVHLDGSLDRMLNIIASNADSSIIFFSNRALRLKSPVYFNNLDGFIGTASYFSTWIGGFGIWRKEFERIDNFSANADLQLVQTDVLCRIITGDGFTRGAIYDEKLCESVKPSKKGGYNFVKIFVDNYFTLLEKYVANGCLSVAVFRKVKSKILFSYIFPTLRKMVTRGERLDFDTNGLSLYIRKHYASEIYFPLAIIGVTFYKTIFTLKGSRKVQ